MAQSYSSELWTGCGSNRARLTFLDDGSSALIELHSDWMGQGLIKYKFECEHLAISDQFGLLRVVGSEVTGGAADSATEEETDDLPDDLVLEYLKINRCGAIAEAGLARMQAWGYAGWNQEFDLVLLTGDHVPPAEESREGKGLWTLDKMKFDSRLDLSEVFD